MSFGILLELCHDHTYDVCPFKKRIFKVKKVAVCGKIKYIFVLNRSVNYVVSLNTNMAANSAQKSY